MNPKQLGAPIGAPMPVIASTEDCGLAGLRIILFLPAAEAKFIRNFWMYTYLKKNVAGENGE